MTSMQAVAALLLLQATATLAAPTISLPLTHRELSGLAKAERALTQLTRLQAKLQNAKAAWNANKNPTSVTAREAQPQKRANVTTSTGSTQLTEFFSDDVDIAYYVTVSVGTPAQQFRVVADTGSSDFWIAAPNSKGINETFAPTSSSTYQSTTIPNDITYGTGAFKGFIGSDTVSLAGFTSASSTLSSGVVNDQAFSNRFLSGIMGFAWPQIAGSGNPTFMGDLIKQGALAEPILSVHLGRGVDTLKPNTNVNGTIATGGSLTFGGTDASTYTGPINYFPIVQQAHWVVQAEGIVVDGQVVSGTDDVQIMMDSGTSLIAMPTTMLRTLAVSMSARIDSPSGLAYLDCSEGTLPSVSFRLGGNDYSIAPEDLVTTAVSINSSSLARESGIKQGGLLCFLPFMGGQEEPELGQTKPMIIAGDTFLKSWTSVYDMGQSRVGLARANPPSQFNSTGDAINARLTLEEIKNVDFANGGVSRARVSGAVLGSALASVLYVLYSS